jgi:hypothetical protein
MLKTLKIPTTCQLAGLFILVPCLLFTVQGVALAETKASIMAGPMGIDFQFDNPSMESESETGFQLGGSLEKRTGRFSAASIQLGMFRHITGLNSRSYGDWGDLEITYLTTSCRLKLFMTETEWTPFLTLGPGLDFRVSATHSYVDSDSVKSSQNASDSVSAAVGFVEFGAGLQGERLSAELIYRRGVSQLLSSPEDSGNISSIKLLVGYSFGLGGE